MNIAKRLITATILGSSLLLGMAAAAAANTPVSFGGSMGGGNETITIWIDVQSCVTEVETIKIDLVGPSGRTLYNGPDRGDSADYSGTLAVAPGNYSLVLTQSCYSAEWGQENYGPSTALTTAVYPKPTPAPTPPPATPAPTPPPAQPAPPPSNGGGGGTPPGSGGGGGSPGSSDVYNCSDFATQPEAQSLFAQSGIIADPHNLDVDDNGIACEEFPYGSSGSASGPSSETGNGDFEEGDTIFVGLFDDDENDAARAAARRARGAHLIDLLIEAPTQTTPVAGSKTIGSMDGAPAGSPAAASADSTAVGSSQGSSMMLPLSALGGLLALVVGLVLVALRRRVASSTS